MNNEIELKINSLKNAILKYDDEYFDKDNSDAEDHIYDQLMDELIDLEKKYPQFATEDSPTKRVGGSTTNTFATVIHKRLMQSLGKSLNKKVFSEWFYKMVEDGVREFFAEYKIDGVALSVEYENNFMIQGATRGDGVSGDDVTATAKKVQYLPMKLNWDEIINTDVRGEVYISKSNFIKLNEYLISIGKKPLKNARNAASGLMKRKEVTKENEFLTFMAYYIGEQDFEPADYKTQMMFLEKMGFQTSATSTGIEVNVDEIGVEAALKVLEHYFDDVEKNRENLDFDIDGIVIKANKIDDQERLGIKTNVPNWAIAYKFPAQEKVTILDRVEWTMGNKGNITPNARLRESVELVGATINDVTLHNLNELKKLDIMIGDSIVVSRQGDVIPKVKRVLKDLRTGNEIPIEIPSQCPACNSPTVINGAYLNCSMGEECSHMDFARIKNFVISMEIEEFGDVKIQELVDVGIVKDVADLYDKQPIDFEYALTRVGKRLATKMYNSVQESRDKELYRVLDGLTIDGIGTTTSKDLANKYKSLGSFINCTVGELVTIDGIAELTANKIVGWCLDVKNRNLIQKLIDRNVGKMNEKVVSSNKLEGKVFSTSGTLSIKRKELEAKLEDNGSKLISVKKETTHFIAGEGAKQDKIDKALKFNAQIITEKEFEKMLED